MKKNIATILAALCLCAVAVKSNAQSPSLAAGVTEIGNAVSSSTNWSVLAGYGRSTENANNLAFAAVAYNLNNNVGFVLGYDYLWNAKNNQFSAVKGGVSLQLPMHPFSFLGSTALTNITATPFVADLIATPRNGDAIGNIVTTGVNFDLYGFKNFELGAGVQYEKRSGQGEFNGNYILFHLGISRKF